MTEATRRRLNTHRRPVGRHRRREEPVTPKRLATEIVVIVGIALVLSFLIKTFLVQPFYIPSGSMKKTLMVSDRIVASKLTPSVFPLGRGDIVVFEDPGGWLSSTPRTDTGGIRQFVLDALVDVGLAPSTADNHLIKRVIGLPGDHVVCCTAAGKLSVNGTEITEPYLYPGDVPSTERFDIRVPAGKIWVMGDHRSDSGDSRFHPLGGDGSEGSVPIDNVVGRAVAIVWPTFEMRLLNRPDIFDSVPAATPGPATSTPATSTPAASTPAASADAG